MNQKHLYLCVLLGISMSAAAQGLPALKTNTNINQAFLVSAPVPQTGIVLGVVMDSDGAAIPGAEIVLQGTDSEDRRSVRSEGDGHFQVTGVRPDVSYQISVHEDGFGTWNSTVLVQPGQHLEMEDIKLDVSAVVTSVTAATSEQIATEQVHEEEHQRVLGIFPNFYVSYSPNPQPLTTALKYKLALHAATDPVTLASSAFLAGIYQASDTPGYVEGAKGYGQRFGAAYAAAASDVLIGGAILPSLLHQDPRYFYMGKGTKKQRALHALAAPFITKGDNGKQQFNYSSVGGDILTGALQNVYYPPTDRGAHLVVDGALLGAAGRILNALAQEFLLNKVTTRGQQPAF